MHLSCIYMSALCYEIIHHQEIIMARPIPPRRLQLLQLQLELNRVQAQNQAQIAQLALNRRRRRRRRRTIWVKPWLLRRPELGMYEQLMVELQNDVASFRNFLRMEPPMFRTSQDSALQLSSPTAAAF